MKHIVKRRGHRESFDERKLYASVFATFLTGHYPVKKAEKQAARITASVKRRIWKKTVVDSQEIFESILKEMEKIDAEIAFLYETHRDLS